MTTPRLKLCPFCGGPAKVTHGMGEYWVNCQDCEAGTDFAVTEAEAVTKWNRRMGTNKKEKTHG